jgi:hypothetical protein
MNRSGMMPSVLSSVMVIIPHLNERQLMIA